MFERYIGIDYSGAETPTSGLKGLRLYAADRDSAPVEVPVPPGRRKYWSRQTIAAWLVEQLSEDRPTIVGIDHGFSFPLRYFEVHRLPPDWAAFLDDFQRHCIGRPIVNMSTSTSSATGASVTAGRAWATRAGDG